jgi:hypothetical protein
MRALTASSHPASKKSSYAPEIGNPATPVTDSNCEGRRPKNTAVTMKLLNRFLRIALVVMSAHYPRILIVGNDGCARGAENQPHVKAANDFCVGQMRNDLVHGPFLRSEAPAQFGRWYTLDEAIELLGGCGLHDKRLLAFHVPRMRCVYCCGVSFMSSSASDHGTLKSSA